MISVKISHRTLIFIIWFNNSFRLPSHFRKCHSSNFSNVKIPRQIQCANYISPVFEKLRNLKHPIRVKIWSECKSDIRTGSNFKVTTGISLETTSASSNFRGKNKAHLHVPALILKYLISYVALFRREIGYIHIVQVTTPLYPENI